ncbi:MAG TPA: hypothetical protein VFA90_08685 [Terriglobales bacterium]|nr:hypothetical protein [Terriglobales bacterium]
MKDLAGSLWYISTAKGENYKPQGLFDVNPYLHPQRAEPLIAFLKRAFEAEDIAKYVAPDGVVNHAAVRVGESVIEMGEAHGKYETMPAMFYLYVPDADAKCDLSLAKDHKKAKDPCVFCRDIKRLRKSSRCHLLAPALTLSR